MMTELDKIKHILKHFIEHTEEHAKEFEDLAEKASSHEGGQALSSAIRQAAKKLMEAIEILKPLV
ncbi:MAG: hypothetical protein N2Z40_02980 [Caldimicrobium sp.]|nr:hypothetical protein [Caldimicrobium sp.]MCX7613171.1 hypothetical protein [Caldimicrobium sp.]MDW8182527.1 hypothetical protein [Caldimicrobium sp.]